MPLTAGRLTREKIAENFAELHVPLTAHEASVAADRCYFCYDAPCVTACPTDIDIPMFIRQIAAGQPQAAGMTILDRNILGGMCARVCPTETLCEDACVRETAESEPVMIGRLQRFATDAVMAREGHPYARSPATGKSVGIVGAGPAGLACAHRLALYGHDAVLYDARPKGGGLNEYGIAAYKTVDDFAQAELDWLLAIGGITLKADQALGTDVTLADLQSRHDAVVLALGLAGVNRLACPGAEFGHVEDAVSFITRVRQDDLSTIPVGRNVVVIGGGMTAIDAAVQAKLIGAETVTIAYRRTRDLMGASPFEQDLAASRGVTIRERLSPQRIADGVIDLEYTDLDGGTVSGTGEIVSLPADHVLVAIGQSLDLPVDLALEGRKIAVTGLGRTSLPGVWAAGDCTPGEDLTVVAVAEGRDVAEDIHLSLIEG